MGGILMVSRTKPDLNHEQIQSMFDCACMGKVLSFEKLGDGEYNGVYDVKTDMGSYVLKVSPLDETGILSYEKDMMRGEVFWYAQLRTHTQIKVPYVYYKDFSHTVFPSDFFIMERMDGEQLNNAQLSKEEKLWCKEETARLAAQMHKVTNDKYGYIQNGLHADWHSALKDMTTKLVEDAQRKGRKSRKGKKLLSYIDKYADVLNTAPCVMVNYDLWEGNILFVRKNEGAKNEGAELVLIDPERTFWGDPVFEFANLEGGKMLDKKKISLNAYNLTAKAKLIVGKDEMLRYAFGIAYLALILECEKYYRYTLHHFGWWRNVSASAYLYRCAFKILK